MQNFHERFEVLQNLSQGSSKRVRLAFDRLLQRQVAIASMLAKSEPDLGLREARTMARTRDCERIVPIYDVIIDGEEIHLVMQYMEQFFA